MNYGAKLVAGGVEFWLWAPEAARVAVVVDGTAHKMRPGENGEFHAIVTAAAGARYRYRIDDGMEVPDPASRRQSQDVQDDSVVVDPAYDWQHADWRGRPWHETVVYELHAGACGGFAGIAADLPRLAAIGITAIELMPIADFPGRHNWGYDGVLIYAPDSSYGTPDELRAMIDAAHGLGISVFLDVVYNHFGPDGNYLNVYAKSFFRDDVHTPWGNAIDFRRPHVRRFFIENALYWLNDYRFDGLRFDAVHAIDDEGFLLEMAAAIRSVVTGREVHLILENERNQAELLRITPDERKFDAQWADDWHHCAHVLLTGESEGYYEDFPNPAAQLARCLTEGFAYQGEASAHAAGAARGTASGHLPSTAFVICLQNHDQIGNRAMGERLRVLARPEALRAAAALLLLTPQIPMLFMGEEWGEEKPFLYFTDHNDELGGLVRDGRRREFGHFAAFTHPETREKIPDPNARDTFEASVPVMADNEWTALYTECLAVRRARIMPGMPGCVSLGTAVISAKAVRATWRMGDGALLTIAANFGDAPVACAAGEGEALFCSSPARFADDMLPEFTSCAWIKAP